MGLDVSKPDFVHAYNKGEDQPAYQHGLASASSYLLPGKEKNFNLLHHCGHTTMAIWVSSLISVLRLLSHHVQFLHLLSDKRLKMLRFQSIFVHQIHIVSLSFKMI